MRGSPRVSPLIAGDLGSRIKTNSSRPRSVERGSNFYQQVQELSIRADPGGSYRHINHRVTVPSAQEASRDRSRTRNSIQRKPSLGRTATTWTYQMAIPTRRTSARLSGGSVNDDQGTPLAVELLGNITRKKRNSANGTILGNDAAVSEKQDANDGTRKRQRTADVGRKGGIVRV